MSKQTLVTGAGGFIGSHLTQKLVEKGYNVRAMVRYNSHNNWGWLETLSQKILNAIEIFPADICDPFMVQKCVAGCKMVFHLAALIPIPYSYLAPASFVNTNILGTLNILQACVAEKVEKFVHVSSSETYGTAQYRPIDENHPLVAQSPYAASKIAADKLAESFHRSYNLPLIIARPFNAFGPRQSARAVIPTIISQSLSGKNSIRLGNLDTGRDFTYVTDTANGIIAAGELTESLGEVINIGSGEIIRIDSLAKMIVNICGSSAKIEFDEQRARPKNSEITELICDATKARTLLKWQPEYSFRKGLEETAEWINENFDLYKADIYNI
jgi:NAD dependent epimerase/dehydratase